jgi:hypothetical protein
MIKSEAPEEVAWYKSQFSDADGNGECLYVAVAPDFSEVWVWRSPDGECGLVLQVPAESWKIVTPRLRKSDTVTAGKDLAIEQIDAGWKWSTPDGSLIFDDGEKAAAEADIVTGAFDYDALVDRAKAVGQSLVAA